LLIALLRAVDALETVLAARIEDREEILQPSWAAGRSCVALPALTAAYDRRGGTFFFLSFREVTEAVRERRIRRENPLAANAPAGGGAASDADQLRRGNDRVSAQVCAMPFPCCRDLLR
jgi:hypothetical protein